MSASWSSWWGACSARGALSSLVAPRPSRACAANPESAYVGRHFPTISVPRSVCYVHQWFVLTKEKPRALGQEPPIKSPAQRAPPMATSRTHRLAQGSVDFRLHLPDVVAVCKKGREKSVTLS